ncbi:MAG: electron transport complex subunit RsxC, partial [Pseudomonadales bacterium]
WRTRNPIADYTQLDKSTLIKIISDAGISGMGGAGFPTSIKLNTRDDTAIDTLILNATECEPYITADHSLMREYADEIASGVAILAKIIKPTKILFGIEDNKLDVVDGITAALAQHNFAALTGHATEAEVITFPTKYPSGGEKQLIQILTGKEVPSGGLPAQLGIVCQNIGTAVAIHNAVCLDEPLISRITTVTGDAVNQPCNYHTLLGTPVKFLLAQSDYQENQSARLIMGGPMMGFALANTTVPVIKTSNCILAPTEQELPTPPPAQACIRCGMCAEACPASLLPQQLYWFAQGKELDKLEEHNIADCIECGACSYVCPSNIPLVQYYRASKVDIKQRKVDHQNAELAKERFDARQERLQRLEDEKIAARQARRAAVEAAVERVKAKKAKSVQEFTDSPETQKTKEAKEKESQANIIATESDDPIARAVAKRAAQQAEDAANPENKLIRAIDNAEQRISKSQSRVIDAEANNDENLAIFKQAVEKAEAKLASAQQALIDFRAQNSA